MVEGKILITGGAGFIGGYLVEALASSACQITCFDVLHPQIHGSNPQQSSLLQAISGKATLVRGDVRNVELLSKYLAEADYVVHLAAETGTGQSMYEIQRYFDVNVQGTASLMQAILNNRGRIKKLIVASSRAVYGEGKYNCSSHGIFYPLPRKIVDLRRGIFQPQCPVCGSELEAVATPEDSPIHPASIYGITKYAQEATVLTCAASVGLNATALRFQNVYGPRQSLSNPYTGLLAVFTNLLLRNQEVNVFEDGRESRDFIYVSDAARAIVLSLAQEEVSGCYNIGTGRSIPVIEIAETMRKVLGSQSKVSITGDFRAGDIRHNFACVESARKALGFKASTSIEEGLTNFCGWAASQGVDASVAIERAKAELEQYGLSKK